MRVCNANRTVKLIIGVADGLRSTVDGVVGAQAVADDVKRVLNTIGDAGDSAAEGQRIAIERVVDVGDGAGPVGHAEQIANLVISRANKLI